MVQFNHSVMCKICDPMDCSMPGLPVHHQLPDLSQTHVHQVSGTFVSKYVFIMFTVAFFKVVWNWKIQKSIRSYQFSSVAQSCPTLCNPMYHSTPDLPVHHQLLESTQTHVHWASDAIQPSHLLSSPSPPALNLSQHQGLFQWVSFSHQVAKVLEFQLQHQCF